MRLSAMLSLAAAVLLGTAAGAYAQATGEQDRTYQFPGTDEQIPYHLYVPTKWTPAARLPLVVVTHGANQPATAPFQRPMDAPTLAKIAEAHGYIVAARTATTDHAIDR